MATPRCANKNQSRLLYGLGDIEEDMPLIQQLGIFSTFQAD
ncbi:MULTISPECIES: hypothetical protein [unclassified Nostoc]|nr:hypothetical protein [Nostoc sp. JL33]